MNKLLMTAAAALISVGSAGFAGTLHPTSDDGGSLPGGLARGVGADAYDGDASTYFELEFDESIEFYFAPEVFGPPGAISEITFGSRDSWEEYIMVEVGIAGDAGSFITATPNPISNAVGGSVAFTFAGTSFNTIRVTDVTLANTSGLAVGQVAGFDIAEISVSTVPLPAGALLLGTALAGFGITRRRTKK